MATALVLTMGACADRSEPVASVTVGVDRDEVPRGRHVMMAYRFEVFPEIATVGGEHRVFVHFLTDEQEVMWQDDHVPPVRVEDWRPGDVVEYTRRMMIPAYPYIGESTVAVGIYSTSSGERLPLLAADLGDRTYSGTTVTFAPGHESGMLFYEGGWHGEESDRGSAERWRWTSERAGLTFRNPRTDATLYLDVQAAPRGVVDGPQHLRVRSGENVVHEEVLELGERRFLEIGLLRQEMGDGASVSLDIDVEPVFVPAALASGGADERRLGVRVYYAFLDEG